MQRFTSLLRCHNKKNSNLLIQQRLLSAVKLRQSLCGLPNAFATVFRAADGVNDGLPEDMKVDIFVEKQHKQHKQQQRSLFVSPSTSPDIDKALQQEGYTRWWSHEKNKDKKIVSVDDDDDDAAIDENATFAVSELGVKYPDARRFLRGDPDTMLRGRLARSLFFEVAAMCAMQNAEESNVLTVNARTATTANTAAAVRSSAFCHLAALAKCTSVIVVEPIERCRVECAEILAANSEELQANNDDDDVTPTFVSITEPEQTTAIAAARSETLGDEHFANVAGKFQLVGLEIDAASDGAVSSGNRFALLKAIDFVAPGGFVFILASGPCGAQHTVTRLLRDALDFTQLRQQRSALNRSGSSNISSDENDSAGLVVAEDINIAGALRVVNRVGAGSEFPSLGSIDACYDRVCGVLLEVLL